MSIADTFHSWIPGVEEDRNKKSSSQASNVHEFTNKLFNDMQEAERILKQIFKETVELENKTLSDEWEWVEQQEKLNLVQANIKDWEDSHSKSSELQDCRKKIKDLEKQLEDLKSKESTHSNEKKDLLHQQEIKIDQLGEAKEKLLDAGKRERSIDIQIAPVKHHLEMLKFKVGFNQNDHRIKKLRNEIQLLEVRRDEIKREFDASRGEQTEQSIKLNQLKNARVNALNVQNDIDKSIGDMEKFLNVNSENLKDLKDTLANEEKYLKNFRNLKCTTENLIEMAERKLSDLQQTQKQNQKTLDSPIDTFEERNELKKVVQEGKEVLHCLKKDIADQKGILQKCSSEMSKLDNSIDSLMKKKQESGNKLDEHRQRLSEFYERKRIAQNEYQKADCLLNEIQEKQKLMPSSEMWSERFEEVEKLLVGKRDELMQMEGMPQTESSEYSKLYQSKMKPLHEELCSIAQEKYKLMETIQNIEDDVIELNNKIGGWATIKLNISHLQAEIDAEKMKLPKHPFDSDFEEAQQKSKMIKKKIRQRISQSPPSQLREQLYLLAEAIARFKLTKHQYGQQLEIDQRANQLAQEQINTKPRFQLDEQAIGDLFEIGEADVGLDAIEGCVSRLAQQKHITAS